MGVRASARGLDAVPLNPPKAKVTRIELYRVRRQNQLLLNFCLRPTFGGNFSVF